MRRICLRNYQTPLLTKTRLSYRTLLIEREALIYGAVSEAITPTGANIFLITDAKNLFEKLPDSITYKNETFLPHITDRVVVSKILQDILVGIQVDTRVQVCTLWRSARTIW